MKALKYLGMVAAIGSIVCYFTFGVNAEVPKETVKQTRIEYSQKKVEDWSKEPNEKKKAYLEHLYNTSTKSE
jgi:hypothetical protein